MTSCLKKRGRVLVEILLSCRPVWVASGTADRNYSSFRRAQRKTSACNSAADTLGPKSASSYAGHFCDPS